MTFTDSQLDEMANIVNDAFKSSDEFKDFAIQNRESFMRTSFLRESLINWADSNDNPIMSIFNKLSKNRITDRAQFFHFKSSKFAEEIIATKKIQVSNLLSNQENDFAELSEFYKRLGLYHKLTSSDQSASNGFTPDSPTLIDYDRGHTLILCFTKDCHKDVFWEKYAASDTGVCLGFRFEVDFKKPENLLGFDFRDVCYDHGYRFDFLNHINYHFIKKFGHQLYIGGVSKFAKFYKRGKFEWENEVRLVFDYTGGLGGNGDILKQTFPLLENTTSDRKYIEVPLGNDANNPYFSLTIDEVICGKHVEDEIYDRLKVSLANNFPQATIWKRV